MFRVFVYMLSHMSYIENVFQCKIYICSNLTLPQGDCRDIIAFAAADKRDAHERGMPQDCPILSALATINPKKSDPGIIYIICFVSPEGFNFSPYDVDFCSQLFLTIGYIMIHCMCYFFFCLVRKKECSKCSPTITCTTR